MKMASEGDRRAYLGFYDQLGFAPTRVDSESRRHHLSARLSLYRQLGLVASTFRSASVLELGPGSGTNAEFMAFVQPGHYTLMDGSQAVLANLERQLGQVMPEGTVSLRLVDFDDLPHEGEGGFDVVLAEGFLSLQSDPQGMALSISRQVKPAEKGGGVLVFSCASSVSFLSELLRRYVAQETFAIPETSTDKVANFFSQDFSYLPGMTRMPEDWVLDTVYHPYFSRHFFTLEDAISVMRKDFDWLGSSPRFFSDGLWFKDPECTGSEASWERLALAAREFSPALLDRRIPWPDCRFATKRITWSQLSQEIASISDHIAEAIMAHTNGGAAYSLTELAEDIIELRKAISYISAPTGDSLRSLRKWARTGKPQDLTEFRQMWGRGQQFISAVR